MSVRLENVTKVFTKSETPAVSDVTFEAPPFGVTSIIGPSGAGKSTVLRLIAGLEAPDIGVVRIAGSDVARTPIQRRGVGLVFQNYALFGHMTVRENIAFGLTVRSRDFFRRLLERRSERDKINERVTDLLRLVQLQGYDDRLPSQLSGGQRQRVAFARALAIEPNVLLLDEPFGALDARVRAELREWLHGLQQQTRVTTLLVTHDQDEALEISQHVVIMQRGKVAQTGSPEDVYDNPVSPEVASFLGANVLRGHVRSGRALVGPVVADAPRGANDGDSVNAFVQPQDVKLTAATSPNDGDVRLGTIERARVVGSRVKVLLLLANGDQVNVEMPRDEFDALAVSEGEQVYLDARSPRVFLGDYSI